MENASKALLIAGAILIVIVLISIGMVIVQSSQGLVTEAQDMTTEQEITAFNNRFTTYQGTQKGSAVQTLLNTVSTNNATNSSGRIITIIMTDSKLSIEKKEMSDSTELTQFGAQIVSSARYNVVMEKKSADGYIEQISITRK